MVFFFFYFSGQGALEPTDLLYNLGDFHASGARGANSSSALTALMAFPAPESEANSLPQLAVRLLRLIHPQTARLAPPALGTAANRSVPTPLPGPSPCPPAASRGRGAAEGAGLKSPRSRQQLATTEPPPTGSAHSPGQGTQHRHEVPAEGAPGGGWRDRHPGAAGQDGTMRGAPETDPTPSHLGRRLPTEPRARGRTALNSPGGRGPAPAPPTRLTSTFS